EPIKRLARLTNVVFGEAAPTGAVQLVVDEATIALPIGDVIDLKEETDRLTKEIEKISKEADGIKKRLSNSNFTSKAPPEVVEENRERLASVELQRNKLEMALKRLAEA
ncbi:MAG: valine--tRNA ligase, partial [Rhodospirillales bacterium]